MWSEEVARALDVEVSEAEPRPVADVESDQWHEALAAARDVLECDFFDWLSAVDEAGDGMRMVAHLWSLRRKRGLLVRTLLQEGRAVPSVVALYPGAAWHERETHEMFGIEFDGHANPAPLLLTAEFEGHPLRKDFVLASRVAKPWPGAKEPGGDHAGPRKRQPMRPPGVPAPGEWGPQPAEDGE